MPSAPFFVFSAKARAASFCSWASRADTFSSATAKRGAAEAPAAPQASAPDCEASCAANTALERTRVAARAMAVFFMILIEWGSFFSKCSSLFFFSSLLFSWLSMQGLPLLVLQAQGAIDRKEGDQEHQRQNRPK